MMQLHVQIHQKMLPVTTHTTRMFSLDITVEEYSLWHIKINKCRLCHQWYTAVKLWFSDKTAYILFLPAVLSVKSWNNL